MDFKELKIIIKELARIAEFHTSFQGVDAPSAIAGYKSACEDILDHIDKNQNNNIQMSFKFENEDECYDFHGILIDASCFYNDKIEKYKGQPASDRYEKMLKICEMFEQRFLRFMEKQNKTPLCPKCAVKLTESKHIETGVTTMYVCQTCGFYQNL